MAKDVREAVMESPAGQTAADALTEKAPSKRRLPFGKGEKAAKRRAARDARRQRYPLTSLVVMFGGWILIYLLQNTDNPISQALNMPYDSFYFDARLVDYLVLMGGNALIFVACVALLFFGVGRQEARRLLLPGGARVGDSDAQAAGAGASEGAKPRKASCRQIVLAVVFAVLVLGSLVAGMYLAFLFPEDYLYEMPFTLYDFQFETVGLALTIGFVMLVKIAIRQLFIAVPIALAQRRGLLPPGNALKWVLFVLVLFVYGSVVWAEPSFGFFLYCVTAYGLCALVSGLYFHASRNYPAMVLACWGVVELLGAVLYQLA